MNQTAQAILKDLMEKLGHADNKLIDRQVDELIQQNAQLTGNSNGFLLGGRFFTNLPKIDAMQAKKIPLHASLYEQGYTVLTQQNQLREDMTRLKQGLSVLLFDCYTLQDFVDALPDMAKHLLPKVDHLQRTRPEAYTLQDKPFSMNCYPATKELLEYYISTRILI